MDKYEMTTTFMLLQYSNSSLRSFYARRAQVRERNVGVEREFSEDFVHGRGGRRRAGRGGDECEGLLWR